MFSYILNIATACIAWWEVIDMLEIFAYRTVTVVQFTDQNWISKTVYCIRCVRFCKIGFISCNAKIALLRASMLVTYYIKLFRRGIYRHNAILMFLLLLVAKKKSNANFSLFNIFRKCSQKCLREVAFKPFKFVLKDFSMFSTRTIVYGLPKSSITLSNIIHN